MAADAAATTECAQALARLLPPGTRVSHSPLQRCAQLAQALHELRPDLACASDPRLQEIDFGAWEGRAWQDIAPAELQSWTDGFADYAVGGSGESTSQVMARVAAAFDELQGRSDTLWITHAGVVRAVELIARGVRQIARADEWPPGAPAYGQWCTLELNTHS
ncbi:fructose-2,6-bisphosphatase [Polaromonas sp. CF318]|nr:fructose-2,6-bisphosphatase [Polaromonas sp. CF318]